MKSLRFLDRRAGYSLASIGLLLGMVAPAVLPTFASAGVLTSRSITLSSSAISATGVTYDLKFTGVASISGSGATDGGVAIDFCSNNPLIGDSCTAPAGLDTSSVTIGTVKYNGSSAASNGSVVSGAANNIVWTANDDYTGGQTLELPLGGIVNPSAIGAFYARVTTYADDTALGSYSTGATPTVGSYSDSGAIAMSATNGVGVTAYVLESMTFCVSKANPGPNCGASGNAVTAPNVTLGEAIAGGGTALDSGHLSTDSVYAQLSTNANGGAVVNLKTNATSCGGLFRLGNTANCNIAPETTSGANDLAAGVAKFGLTVGSSTSVAGATAPSGTLSATNGYDATHYFIDYVGGNATGVTSTYGSNLFNTGGSQVSNKYVQVTFGASVSNVTPAGIYGATLNMIATGTF